MNKKNVVRWIVFFVAIPLVIVAGFTLFKDRQYAFVSAFVALLSCVPFFLAFDKKEKDVSQRLMLLAVTVTVAVLGRFVFAFIPFFKPVTAIIIIFAIYFGPDIGFLCGAFTALISNFYFGQGPWTPFQMFTWGIIGLFAGLAAKHIRDNRFNMVAYGVFGGVLYSLLMDVWTVIWFDGTFNPARYVAVFIAALPVTAMYAISNGVFLLVAMKPVGKKLDRIKTKYGL